MITLGFYLMVLQSTANDVVGWNNLGKFGSKYSCENAAIVLKQEMPLNSRYAQSHNFIMENGIVKFVCVPIVSDNKGD